MVYLNQRGIFVSQHVIIHYHWISSIVYLLGFRPENMLLWTFIIIGWYALHYITNSLLSCYTTNEFDWDKTIHVNERVGKTLSKDNTHKIHRNTDKFLMQVYLWIYHDNDAQRKQPGDTSQW